MPSGHPIATRAAALLDDRVLGFTALHGGDLSEVLRIGLGSGASVVAKSGRWPAREARMLRAIRAAGAPAPGVLAADAHILVLEDLGPAVAPSARAWRRLGRALGVLHGATAGDYGWDEDHAFGPVDIRNGRCADWPAFWTGRRLLADAGRLPADIARRIAAARGRIRDVLPERPPASLLHGDLWTGNVHFAVGDAPWLIDPASYYGHAEADLAMLTLFGAPPTAFWDGYGPLAGGWEDRRAVYQLWPALVHLRLFGSGYRGLVERLLERIGA